MLSSPWIAALIALFAWWFSTGVILFVVRRADHSGGHLWATLTNLPMLILGGVGLWYSAPLLTIEMVYLAFFSALLVWGWIEMAFLTGVITGPNRTPLQGGEPEWERFLRAWGTVAYHEIVLVGVLIALLIFGASAANPFGVATFTLLFAARVSAKLNLYLGVRKVNTEFIPTPLQHLPSHFREARVNWLFPTSVTALTFAVVMGIERAAQAPTLSLSVGYALFTTMTALALLEHWFMVLRLPDEKLWRWMLPKRPIKTPPGGPADAL